MSIGKLAAIALVAFLLPIAAVRAEDYRVTAANKIKDHTKGITPFRLALKEKLKARKDKKQKLPEKDPSYWEPVLVEDEDGLDDATGAKLGWGPGDCEDKKRCPADGYVVKYRALTTLKYQAPNEVYDEEPGAPHDKKARWPKPLVQRKVYDEATKEWRPVLDENGQPVFDDYTDLYKSHAQAVLGSDPVLAGRPLWKVDPSDPDDPGYWEFGLEPLEEEMTEEITFTFKKEDQAQGKAFFRSLMAAMAAGDTSAERAILMGFTYQGPNIDYTVGSTKRACLPLVGCATLWDIKAGFALDFGLGLRVPAFSRLSGPAQLVVPTPGTFTSEILTTGSYGDWSAPTFSANGVSAYSDRGDPKGEGNEFVMYFEFFAGAKVIIAGANVCPYCQYVEVNIDYSESFGTPFGAGSFPIPDVRFPIKDFNYGIVSLVVGLKVHPELRSNDIAAVASTGAALSHASSTSPATFSVPACIPAEAPKPRYVEVSVDQYRYVFDYFTVTLGAYLDLNVGGYGAWAPEFDFMTLNLSSALGALGASLPDHRSCNHAFQCATVPASPRVTVKSELLDETPPATALATTGTVGARGWWRSDVTATMTATDHPAGCGAGVGSTYWNLDGGAYQTTNPFQLTSERKMAVTYASADKDGNPETAHALQVWIDKTPPTITGAPTTLPNVDGWYNHDVVVAFDPKDPGAEPSGVFAWTQPVTVRDEAANQSVVGTVEDTAGWTASTTVGGINVDKTAPTITISEPTEAGVYDSKNTYTFAWTIVDDLSHEKRRASTLDGKTTSPTPFFTPIVSGAAIDFVSMPGGAHELFVTATDFADNTAAKTVRFVVDVDIKGLIAATVLACDSGWLTRGACKSLTAKAQQGDRALTAGNANGARGVLLAYATELRALRGRGVKEDAFQLLDADVQYVLRRYGLIGNG